MSTSTATRDSVLDIPPGEARGQLQAWFRQHGLPDWRVRQAFPRLWDRPVPGWREASDLPASLRQGLDLSFPLPRLALEVRQDSADGTSKFLWRLQDGEAIESVLIPKDRRRTLCISSQSGCALGCVFCATGRMGFRRNLTPFEIVGQVREVILNNPDNRPTNIVFMGMGEPLLNWSAVDTALTILNHPEGLGIGARHITVSTVGIVPGMHALAARPEQFRLAISLHAPTDESRLALMPIEKKYDLDAVLGAARAFRRRITFEYVLIAGRNDSDADADRLAALARPLRAMVNLLPLHPGGDSSLIPASGNRLHAFADRLRTHDVEAVVRRSRGLDIDAACGQLRVSVERKRSAADPVPAHGEPD